MRLINADALRQVLEVYLEKDSVGHTPVQLCDAMPTVDAVPVVRCKDCKYLSLTTLGMEYACWHGAIKVYGETGKECDYTVCQRITNPEHYCSYGERRIDE